MTVELPVALLPQVHAEDFLWQVPGRREEVVTALIRGLPKNLRTAFVPVPDTARAVLADAGAGGARAARRARSRADAAYRRGRALRRVVAGVAARSTCG